MQNWRGPESVSGSTTTLADERVAGVSFDAERLIVDLMDGRTISVPPAWYPRPHSAPAAPRTHWGTARGGAGRVRSALMAGRPISAPLAWSPRLHSATEAQRTHWEIAGGGYGIHWP